MSVKNQTSLLLLFHSAPLLGSFQGPSCAEIPSSTPEHTRKRQNITERERQLREHVCNSPLNSNSAALAKNSANIKSTTHAQTSHIEIQWKKNNANLSTIRTVASKQLLIECFITGLSCHHEFYTASISEGALNKRICFSE